MESKWNVVNGVDGETCTDWKTDDTELWCNFVQIPKCVDRRILCPPPPTPEGIFFFYIKVFVQPKMSRPLSSKEFLINRYLNR
jgi:hypothetical protein